MNARKATKGTVLLLVITAMLIAAVPAAANGDGDPGATIQIAEDGLSFSFSIGGEALAYWAGGITCSGEEFGGFLDKWVAEGTIIAPSQISYAAIAYTFPNWEEGDPYWGVHAYGECPSEPIFDYWGWDAGCMYPFVGARVLLGYGYGKPAVGVEVTFSMDGNSVVTETNEWGYARADFPFELGSDPVIIWIDAGEWGEGSVEVSGPTAEACEPVGSYGLTIACDGMSLAFQGTDGAFGWDFRVQYADGSHEYFDLDGLQEAYTQSFDQPIIWAMAWVYPEWAEDPFDFFDVIGATPGLCPATAEPEPLVEMFVYYSATGFFGGEGPGATNTLTLYSIQGEPTVSRRAYWAGGTLPEDYRLACSGWLMDDGAGGIFECDAFLRSVGERRALLRDDPEGKDLLEQILRYLSWAAP